MKMIYLIMFQSIDQLIIHKQLRMIIKTKNNIQNQVFSILKMSSQLDN